MTKSKVIVVSGVTAGGKTTIIQVTHDKSILKYTDEVINL